MPQHDSGFVRRRIRDDVAAALESVTDAIDPEDFGLSICERFDEAEEEVFASYGSALLQGAYVEEVRRQTKGRRPTSDSEQVEAFPLDSWISASKKGQRVRYRHATWEDHVAHREHQIANVRAVTRAFDVEEKRRERLREVGMADNPGMTTERALERMDEGEDGTSLAAD